MQKKTLVQSLLLCTSIKGHRLGYVHTIVLYFHCFSMQTCLKNMYEHYTILYLAATLCQDQCQLQAVDKSEKLGGMKTLLFNGNMAERPLNAPSHTFI